MRNLLILLALVLSAPTPAHADPTPAPRGLYVAYVEPLGPPGSPIFIELSNGKQDVLTPCKYEDGRHCYWNAGTRGNGKGRSYLVTRGHVFYMNLRGL